MNKWDVYLQEAKTQAEFAEKSYSAFREAEKEALVFDVFFHLHHFLVHAVNIDRILDAKPDSERHTILACHIDLSGIDLEPFRKLRNDLEHFDERLDRWVRDFTGHTFFDLNIITGAKGFPEKAYLRALDGDTYKFQGKSYSMVELHAAVAEIDRRLTTALNRTDLSADAPKPAC